MPKKIIYFICIDIINKNISIGSNKNSNHTSYKKVNVIPSLGFHLPLIYNQNLWASSVAKRHPSVFSISSSFKTSGYKNFTCKIPFQQGSSLLHWYSYTIHFIMAQS